MFAQNAILTKGSIFQKSQETGLNYVLQLDPDRLLSPVESALGYIAKAPSYGGWEARGIHGHSLGHYLSALAGFAAETANQDARDKLNYTVSRLKAIQRKDGYIGGISSECFDRCFSGDVKAERFGLNGEWVPWYSVHKIYAGLIDAYTIAGNKDALEVVTKMCSWAEKGLSKMSDEEIQKMLECEHGGMCKVFADIYEITKEEKYLRCAERLIHQSIVKPLYKKADKLQGYHANTQIPKIIGLAKLYDLTGKNEYREAAEFFFRTITERRSYAIGGNSIGEHFGPELQETLGKDTCETCNTYNMLELAEYIFKWNKDVKTADYYETALYNHILASQDPLTGAKTYFVAMVPGFYKIYGTSENAFWCCTGTGMENPERYGRFIAKDYEGSIYVNLYIPSTYTTKDGWQIQIDSNFPFDSKVSVKVLKAGSSKKSLKIRIPQWYAGDKAEYRLLSENLTEGFSSEIDLPLKLNIRRTRDKSGNFSILYGPIVLAADLGTKGMQQDIVDDHLIYMNNPVAKIKAIKADILNPESWIKEIDPATLTFQTKAEATEDGTVYTLYPFFNIHHVRYAAYFNTGDAPEDPRKIKLDSIKTDSIEPGRQQSEIEHRFKAENTEMGYIPEVDRNCRKIISKDGFITYQLKFDASAKNNRLLLTTYGEDKGTFLVQFEDEEPVTVKLDGNKGKVLVDTELSVPEKLIKEKAAGKKTFIKLVIKIKTEESSSPRLLEIHSIK